MRFVERTLVHFTSGSRRKLLLLFAPTGPKEFSRGQARKGDAPGKPPLSFKPRSGRKKHGDENGLPFSGDAGASLVQLSNNHAQKRAVLPYIAGFPRKIRTYGRRFRRFSRAKRPNFMAGHAQRNFSKFPDFHFCDLKRGGPYGAVPPPVVGISKTSRQDRNPSL